MLEQIHPNHLSRGIRRESAVSPWLCSDPKMTRTVREVIAAADDAA